MEFDKLAVPLCVLTCMFCWFLFFLGGGVELGKGERWGFFLFFFFQGTVVVDTECEQVFEFRNAIDLQATCSA